MCVCVCVYRCYEVGLRNVLQTSSRYYKGQDGYTCGFWGLSRCTRYWTGIEYYNHYIFLTYSKKICCAGTHTGTYPNCIRKLL